MGAITLLKSAVLFTCAICTAGWISGYEAPEHITPIEDVVALSNECPARQGAIASSCFNTYHSCQGRCGDMKLTGTSHLRASCSCDALCHVMEDCCWDYETECPEELKQFEKHYSHFKGKLRISCLEEYAMVDIHSDSETDMKGGLWVTDKKSHLSFRNANIYTYFLQEGLIPRGDDNRTDGQDSYPMRNLAVWGRMITSSKNLTVDELQQRIDSDITEDDVVKDMAVEPSGTEDSRGCKHDLHMKCPKTQSNSSCQSDFSIRTSDMKLMCSLNIDKSNQMTGLQRPDNKSNIDAVECTINEISDKHEKHLKDVAFSVVFNYDHASNQILAEFPVPLPDEKGKWTGIWCRSPKGYECDIGVECEPGFMFLYSACRKPSDLIIGLVGRGETYDIVNFLFNVYHYVRQILPSGMSISSRMEINSSFVKPDSDIVRTRGEFQLASYRIKTRVLEETLIEPMSLFLATMPSLEITIYRTVVCFLMGINDTQQASHKSPLSCYDFMSDENFTSRPFELQGLQHLDLITHNSLAISSPETSATAYLKLPKVLNAIMIIFIKSLLRS